ncbi:MAG: hypothetical protein ACRECM_01720 [Methyloceanibacter sp.]
MMIRISARLLPAVCLLLGALPPGSFARAEEQLVWTEKASAGFVSLAYGALDPAKAPLFLLSCFNAMSIAVLDVRTEMAEAKPGAALTIELSAGDAKSPVEGEAARDDSSGVTFGEASDIAVKPVLDVLRQSGPLTVTIGEASAALSDQGRAEAVEKFSGDCKLD